MVTGLSSEGSGASGSGARPCPGSRPGPVPRGSATSPNPAWRPKPLSLWPPIPPTLHRTLPRASPEPPHSTSNPGLEVLWGGSGGDPMGLRRDERAVGDAVTLIPPDSEEPNHLQYPSADAGIRGVDVARAMAGLSGDWCPISGQRSNGSMVLCLSRSLSRGPDTPTGSGSGIPKVFFDRERLAAVFAGLPTRSELREMIATWGRSVNR